MADLTIKEYAEKVAKELETRISDVQISLNEVNKNGAVFQAITIRPNGMNVGANLYVNNFYEEGMDIKMAATKITKIYESNKPTDEMFDVDGLTDYEQAKSKLRVMLVNTERNDNLGLALKEVPGMKGLSYLPYLLIDSDENGRAIAKMNKNMLRSWGVELDEVIAQATLNHINDGASIKGMFDTLKEMMGLEECMIEDVVPDTPMLVVTNNYKINGAVEVILHSNDIAKRIGGDFIVIPSSRHEVICLPYSSVMEPEVIKEMVEQVNSTEVSAEDYLSDNVYAYVDGVFKTVA